MSDLQPWWQQQTEHYEYSLVGGPQDGALVRLAPDRPQTIYVGPKNLGDRYAAYGREPCERFPARYVREFRVFVFQPEGRQP